MKTLVRITNVFFMLLLLRLITVCEKSDLAASPDEEIFPFSNGGIDRNMIVVISDMHIGAYLT